jgi:PTH2 family peptidyl-tRNA hydrolase
MSIEERQVKQVLVVRKDLNMRKGKIASQCCHASLGAILKLMHTNDQRINEERTLYLNDGSALTAWLKGSFTKICVGVDSELELLAVYMNAIDAGLNTVMIEDNGLTEFHGVKTKTCICIGPDWSNEIDKITKNLKLL